jgi:tRNA pseudouridine32 synthase/23S rRNA pseudouridine746 synthase
MSERILQSSMFDVLHVDDRIIAVNKREGITSIPDRRNSGGSLVEELRRTFSQNLYVVHRLDKEVSGVILFARDAATHSALNRLFSGGAVKKVYQALLHGSLTGTGGTIDKPVREFGSGRMGIDEHRGKSSRTDYDVIGRLPGSTLVKAFPRTGRRHQIRVHFYSIGHPIVGDVRYGDRATQSLFPRLMLHAEEVAFSFPSGETLRVAAPLPATFLDIVDRMRSGSPFAMPHPPHSPEEER